MPPARQRLTQRSQPPRDSGWLLPFLDLLRVRGPRLLELGCGPGLDAARLSAAGFQVTGFDRIPLQAARQRAPEARFLRASLERPLPFRDGAFDAALASLALHYFSWNATRAIVAEVHRVLSSGAPLLFRVNATDDYHHGAGQGEQIEPNFYRTPAPYHAETKRFFDEPTVRAAMAGYFDIAHLAHVTIHRYKDPKRAWECLATRV